MAWVRRGSGRYVCRVEDGEDDDADAREVGVVGNGDESGGDEVVLRWRREWVSTKNISHMSFRCFCM